MKKRILFFNQDGQITGSAISLLNIVLNLDRNSFDPIIALGSEGKLKDVFAGHGFPVHITPIRKFVGVPPRSAFQKEFYTNFRALSANPALARFLKHLSPDVVHINDKSALITGMTAKKLGIPVVWHLRSTYAGKRSFLQYWISRTIIRNSADQMISISEDEVDGFEDFPGLHIIYNGVDIAECDRILSTRPAFREEFNIGEGQLALGMIGNMSLRKGLYDFLAAMKILKDRGRISGLRCFIIASIPESRPARGIRAALGLKPESGYEKARSIIRDFGLDDVVQFTGRRSDILSAIHGLDIVCACYNLWAIGRPGFEAQAMRKPVVVNAGHTGNSKIVEDNINGLVVPRANSQALADAIERLIEDPQLRVKLANAGYEHARRDFNAHTNTKKIEEIYKAILSRR